MIADNQVIEQIDVQYPSRFYKLLCHGNVFNIYRVIEADVNGQEQSNVLPAGTFNNWTQGWGNKFTLTANNFKANPYAVRHSSVESFGALPRGFKSMSLDKAAELINTLLTQWLQTKH